MYPSHFSDGLYAMRGNLMASLDTIKNKIEILYKTNPTIHMDVFLSTPKLALENAEVTIKGVYPHLFRIEEFSNGRTKTHTLQYSQVYTRQVIIHELEETVNN